MTHDGVHQSHCCKKHGCKYGDDDCPVETGRIEQDYPCESCDWEEEDKAQCDGCKKLDAVKGALELVKIQRDQYAEQWGALKAKIRKLEEDCNHWKTKYFELSVKHGGKWQVKK